MKRYFVLMLLFLAIGPAASGFQAPNLEPVRQIWRTAVLDFQGGNPQQGMKDFGRFRESAKDYAQKAKLDWELPYMMGTLQCWMHAPYTEHGRAILKDLLQTSRDIPLDKYKLAESIMQKCDDSQAKDDPGNGASSDSSAFLHTDRADPRPGISGKGGFISRSVASSKTIPAQVSIADLRARIFPLGQGDNALAGAVRRVPAGAGSSSTKRFVLTAEGHDPAFAQGVGQCLERYRDVLEKRFRLQFPPEMVTVYDVATLDSMLHYAATLHGVELPAGTIAYSVYEDRSLVGIGSPDQCGSLAHEVVHLMMKYSVGDSPAWMEEGLASEVAIASIDADDFKFGFSWRDDMLKGRYSRKPKLAELLQMDWNSFAARNENELDRVAAIQAMAAVFIRYLAARNKLLEVYFALHKDHYSADVSEVRSYQQILEQAFGKPVNEIETDFLAWFNREAVANHDIGPTRSDAAPDCTPSNDPLCGQIGPMNAAAPQRPDAAQQPLNAQQSPKEK